MVFQPILQKIYNMIFFAASVVDPYYIHFSQRERKLILLSEKFQYTRTVLTTENYDTYR